MVTYMGNKTKIVVLRMKEIIYSGIFALLGILFLVLLIIMFVPDKEEEAQVPTPSVSQAQYKPGVYTTSIHLGDQVVDVAVLVDENNINSIELVNLSEEVETMFPLVEPSFEDLTSQILASQSLSEVTYSNDAKYTSLIILEAIQTSLDKASVTPNSIDTPLEVTEPVPDIN